MFDKIREGLDSKWDRDDPSAWQKIRNKLKSCLILEEQKAVPKGKETLKLSKRKATSMAKQKEEAASELRKLRKRETKGLEKQKRV